jgi:hypothetical protein
MRVLLDSNSIHLADLASIFRFKSAKEIRSERKTCVLFCYGAIHFVTTLIVISYQYAGGIMHALLVDLYANRCVYPTSVRLTLWSMTHSSGSSARPPVTVNIVIAACDNILIVFVAVIVIFIICHQSSVPSSHEIFLESTVAS